MRLGKVVGKVWATIKDPQLTGIKLYIMQPLTKNLKPAGSPIVVADGVGSGEGEIVYWVGSREGTTAIPGKKIPCDASIVGIVDSAYFEPEAKIRDTLKKSNILEK
jgi:ethanolamine utilization protein EutN